MNRMVTTVTNTSDAATITRTPKKGARLNGAGSRPGNNGGRGPNNGGPGGGSGGGSSNQEGPSGREQNWTPDRYRIGMWVAIASIVMLFTALTSAYIVRAGLPGSVDWRPIRLPALVWFSTALMLASSIALEAARRALRGGNPGRCQQFLLMTFVLGLGFLGSQLLAWRQLVAQGVYLASNPHSSFFYVLTGMHGLHILGGMMALVYVLFRHRRLRLPSPSSSPPPLLAEQRGEDAPSVERLKRQTAVDVMTIYWHFMDGLWIYLLLLLWLWR